MKQAAQSYKALEAAYSEMKVMNESAYAAICEQLFSLVETVGCGTVDKTRMLSTVTAELYKGFVVSLAIPTICEQQAQT